MIGYNPSIVDSKTFSNSSESQRVFTSLVFTSLVFISLAKNWVETGLLSVVASNGSAAIFKTNEFQRPSRQNMQLLNTSQHFLSLPIRKCPAIRVSYIIILRIRIFHKWYCPHSSLAIEIRFFYGTKFV